MNLKQIQTLQSLGIPVWVSQDRKMDLPKKVEASSAKPFLCVLDKQEWLNPKLKELYLKIMQALNWTEDDYELVLWEPGAAKLKPLASQTAFIFGRQFKPSFQCHQVDALSAMSQSPQAKRSTWQTLKPFIKN